MPPDEIQFYVDPSTGLPHLYKHGVTEEEVEEALENADDDQRARRGTREATGLTREGRCILVAYRRNGGIFVITAYELKGQALIAFRKGGAVDGTRGDEMRQELPEGWDEKRVKEIADYYDERAKNGLPLPRPITKRNNYALVEVPKKLLPTIRKLIADFERSEKATRK